MTKKITQNIRFFIVPVLATLAAVFFWIEFRNGKYGWWIFLIFFIAASQYYFFLVKKINN